MNETYAPKPCKQFTYGGVLPPSVMIFLSSIILTINFRSSHYPRQPRSRATVAVHLSDPSSLPQRRCASLHQTWGEVLTCEIVGAPCKDGQITSEFFRPLVSPGMEGMLIHIPKPGKCAIKNSIKSLFFSIDSDE